GRRGWPRGRREDRGGRGAQLVRYGRQERVLGAARRLGCRSCAPLGLVVTRLVDGQRRAARQLLREGQVGPAEAATRLRRRERDRAQRSATRAERHRHVGHEAEYGEEREEVGG